jgi:hypothetical protein
VSSRPAGAPDSLAVMDLETPMVYAGVGSRQAPPLQVARMERLARVLAEHGWTLRTGLAEGADQAFYRGASSGRGPVELYLPWPSFNHPARIQGAGETVLGRPSKEAYLIAQRFHPAWEKVDPPVRALHARNVHQVLGADLKTPAGLLICWTQNGSRDGLAPGTGGTGQALRIAAGYGVPVLNIARHDDAERVRALLAPARGRVS